MIEATAVETLQGVPGAAVTTVTNDKFNVAPTNYSPTSTPPVSRDAYIDETIVAMDGTPITFDLTNCPGGAQSNINATGKKVQRFIFRNLGNADAVIEPSAMNGYELFGPESITF